ncbi:MAG: hypothetical protein JNG86_09030 [Verrucomicrobiaceae bacterium]|nr:hypothetical protein [Verrucomicrobiaceae bacterium]
MTALKLATDAATEADGRRMMGLLVVAGMVALILKGILIARWVAKRRKKNIEHRTRNSE